ncbi:hypothetical protein [Pandoraea soli]|uniref:DUF4020 domain-containing protein n=1 Tax=Pandoraea soli TaxID=2508293 RepID=A0ABY6W992_9BURK|nr:hypothetical protein [Pandoraea soli]VVE42424.1 hypothetical protein PSO31014_04201 [Pandoraea soli]
MRYSIAQRLLKLSTAELCQILNQSADWILAHSRALASESPSTFYRLWAALTASLHEYTSENYAPSTRRRWADESINRPAGVLAQALFRDPQVGVPEVLTRLEQLLALPGDHRRYCLVIFGRQLTWLFHVAPDWTCAKILPISREVDDDADAFWSGFFWGARQPQEALYLLMKESLLRLSRQPNLRSEHAAQLGGMLLLGWLEPLKTSPEPSAITSTEFREALIHSSENLRLDVLRHFKLWMNGPERPLAQRYLDFLQNVWPKQLAVRSRLISGRLAELAFEVPSHFPEIVALTIPRLTRVNGHQAAMAMIGIDEAVVKQNPAASLDLLWTILDDNPQFWPDKTSDLIEWLDGLPEVETDPRLGELRKRRRVG